MSRRLVWTSPGGFVATEALHPALPGEAPSAWEARVLPLLRDEIGIAASDVVGWFDLSELPPCPPEYWILSEGKFSAPPTAANDHARKVAADALWRQLREVVLDLTAAREIGDANRVKDLGDQVKALKSRLGV